MSKRCSALASCMGLLRRYSTTYRCSAPPSYTSLRRSFVHSCLRCTLSVAASGLIHGGSAQKYRHLSWTPPIAREALSVGRIGQSTESVMYRPPVEHTSDHTAVQSSILQGTDCVDTVSVAMPSSCLSTTGSMSRAVRRRLDFDVEDDNDDADRQKRSTASPETVLDYLERLYDDQVARWNMDFRTLTPLKGGRWQWNRVLATTPALSAVDCATVDDSSCSTTIRSRNITTKKRRRQMNGKRYC